MRARLPSVMVVKTGVHRILADYLLPCSQGVDTWAHPSLQSWSTDIYNVLSEWHCCPLCFHFQGHSDNPHVITDEFVFQFSLPLQDSFVNSCVALAVIDNSFLAPAHTTRTFLVATILNLSTTPSL